MFKDVIRIMILHVLILLGSLQKLVDHEEDLVLGELVVEPLHQLLNRSEVGFNLLLCVLVHAELHLGGFGAVHEALDFAQVAHGTVVVGGDVLLLQTGGQILRHLVAAVKDLLILVSEPLAGHLGIQYKIRRRAN